MIIIERQEDVIKLKLKDAIESKKKLADGFFNKIKGDYFVNIHRKDKNML